MTQVTVGLIAAVLSLAGVLITVLISKRNLQKELERKFTEKLYDKRLELYPAAFKITERIFKENAVTVPVTEDRLTMVKKELAEWWGSGAGLMFSKDSIRTYKELTDLLDKKYGDDGKYTPVQLNKLMNARGDFRKSLKDDIGLIFYEEDKKTKQRIRMTLKKLLGVR